MSHMLFTHAAYETSLDLAINLCLDVEPGSVVWIVGPSGIGKTTLRNQLSTLLDMNFGPLSAGQVRIISTSCGNFAKSFFDSKDFHTRCLAQVGDPFRVAKSAFSDANEFDKHIESLLTSKEWCGKHIPNTETNIVQTFENLCNARGVKYFIIDEAHAMRITHTNRDPTDHIESLKNLAMNIGVIVVLMGTYDLLELCDYSSEVGRRADIVHFGRYTTTPEDLGEYLNVLLNLAEQHGICSTVIRENFQYLYSTTLGIIGEANKLFIKSIAIAKTAAKQDDKKSFRVSFATLKAATPPARVLRKLYFDVRTGEDFLEPMSDSELVKLLGDLKTRRKPATSEPKTRRQSARRPGLRKLKRDTTGWNIH